MKVLAFATAILACAIPAFSQVNAPVRGGCEAALVTPGVPSAIIVVPVPTPAPYAGVAGSAHSLRSPGVTAGYPGSSNHSSSTASGVIWGGGTVSGIGAMGTSGIGAMSSSGIGSMERSGIGSIGSPNIGTIVPSGVGLTASTAPSPAPFGAAPRTAVGSPTMSGGTVHQRPPVTSGVLPFICP